jgi:hypothetical protein
MSKYLATYSDTLNNVDVFGFMLMSDKDMERYESLAMSITWSFSYNVSEVDYIDFIDGEEYLSKVEFKELTDEEFTAINNVFGDKFGMIISEDFLKIVLSDEETIDDDYQNLDIDNDYLFGSDDDY